MTTDPKSTKQWLKVVSFLLFIIFMLASALGAVTAELFGQFFDAIIGRAIIDYGPAHFFQTLPLWIWIAVGFLGLFLGWLLIRIRMSTTGGSVPVKTTMLVALMPMAVITAEIFAFLAPTQDILARFDKAPVPGSVIVEDKEVHQEHSDHTDHNHGESQAPPEPSKAPPE